MILTTPPGFRPLHFAAAVEAGKHVFMEKPVAVDPAGCRSVIETARLAKEKKLGVGAGTQRAPANSSATRPIRKKSRFRPATRAIP